jgi:hypothetical protein
MHVRFDSVAAGLAVLCACRAAQADPGPRPRDVRIADAVAQAEEETRVQTAAIVEKHALDVARSRIRSISSLVPAFLPSKIAETSGVVLRPRDSVEEELEIMRRDPRRQGIRAFEIVEDGAHAGWLSLSDYDADDPARRDSILGPEPMPEPGTACAAAAAGLWLALRRRRAA